MRLLITLVAVGMALVFPALATAAEESSRTPAVRPEPIPDMYIVRFTIQNATGETQSEFTFLAGLPCEFGLPAQGDINYEVDASGQRLPLEVADQSVLWFNCTTPPTPGLEVYDDFVDMAAMRPAQPGEYTEAALAQIRAAAPHFSLGGVQFQVYSRGAERVVVRIWRINDEDYFTYKDVQVDNGLPYAERLRQQGYEYLGSLDCAVTCPDLGPLPVSQ